MITIYIVSQKPGQPQGTEVVTAIEIDPLVLLIAGGIITSTINYLLTNPKLGILPNLLK